MNSLKWKFGLVICENTEKLLWNNLGLFHCLKTLKAASPQALEQKLHTNLVCHLRDILVLKLCTLLKVKEFSHINFQFTDIKMSKRKWSIKIIIPH